MRAPCRKALVPLTTFGPRPRSEMGSAALSEAAVQLVCDTLNHSALNQGLQTPCLHRAQVSQECRHCRSMINSTKCWSPTLRRALPSGIWCQHPGVPLIGVSCMAVSAHVTAILWYMRHLMETTLLSAILTGDGRRGRF